MMTSSESDLFVPHPYGDLNLLFVRESVGHWLMGVQRVRKLIWLEETALTGIAFILLNLNIITWISKN